MPPKNIVKRGLTKRRHNKTKKRNKYEILNGKNTKKQSSNVIIQEGSGILPDSVIITFNSIISKDLGILKEIELHTKYFDKMLIIFNNYCIRVSKFMDKYIENNIEDLINNDTNLFSN